MTPSPSKACNSGGVDELKVGNIIEGSGAHVCYIMYSKMCQELCEPLPKYRVIPQKSRSFHLIYLSPTIFDIRSHNGVDDYFVRQISLQRMVHILVAVPSELLTQVYIT